MNKHVRLAAVATAAALALSVLVAAPAEADVRCWGEKVQRCVAVLYNGSQGTVFARARVVDVQTDSANYDVSIDAVRLQVRENDGNWYLISSASDSGWFKEWAEANTAQSTCRNREYRAVTTWRWRVAGSTGAGTSETRYSAIEAPCAG